MKPLVLAFAFTLSLPAFGGTTARIETPTIGDCQDARAAIRKQLMLAGATFTVTACEYVEP